MLQPIYIKFWPYYVKKWGGSIWIRNVFAQRQQVIYKKMLPTNINKECAQISFKSLAIFIRLSDIAYQNIMFIKKL